MNQKDVAKLLKDYADEIEYGAGNTEEVRILLKELKGKLDLRKIWYEDLSA